MRSFCLIGINETKDWKETNEDLKDFIYYYFNSKYAKQNPVHQVDNGDSFCIVEDTNEGKKSEEWVLYKYMSIIKDNVDSSGTPIDNTKHLLGSIRLLRRSLTDSNPILSLLNAFCILFLGTNDNVNLQKELEISYFEGMFELKNRLNSSSFWQQFRKFNSYVEPFSNSIQLSELRNRTILAIHNNDIENLKGRYL